MIGREIFIVDDDPSVSEALAAVFSLEGFQVSRFAEGGSALAATRSRNPACILLDVQMPGRSGLEILRELRATNVDAPIFVISGRGNIPIAIDAVRNGALDFIEKPFDPEAVVWRVRRAIEAWTRHQPAGRGGDVRLVNFAGRELLTPRECQVLAQITGGSSNKEAGRELGISPRTIEVHRARIMEKLGAKNAAHLVRIVLSESLSL